MNTTRRGVFLSRSTIFLYILGNLLIILVFSAFWIGINLVVVVFCAWHIKSIQSFVKQHFRCREMRKKSKKLVDIPVAYILIQNNLLKNVHYNNKNWNSLIGTDLFSIRGLSHFIVVQKTTCFIKMSLFPLSLEFPQKNADYE